MLTIILVLGRGGAGPKNPTLLAPVDCTYLAPPTTQVINYQRDWISWYHCRRINHLVGPTQYALQDAGAPLASPRSRHRRHRRGGGRRTSLPSRLKGLRSVVNPKFHVPISAWLPRQVRDKPLTSPLAQIGKLRRLPRNFGEVGVMEFGLKGRHGFVANVTGKSA